MAEAAVMSEEPGKVVSCPLWARLSWMTFFCVLPTVAVLIFNMTRAADYVGSDNDDAMRLVQVRDLLAGQSWFDLTQTRLGLDGTLMHWSRLIDLPLAALISLFEPIAGAERAEMIALAIWPLLLVTPLLATMGLAGRRIGGPQCMHFCLGLTAILAMTGNRFQAGAIDHHNVQLVLAATMAAMVVDQQYKAVSFGIAGAAAALAVAIGVETTPFVAVVGLVVAILWAWEGRVFAAPAFAFGLTLAATVSAAFFLTVPPRLYGVVTCDDLSITFLSLSATSGILLALAAMAASRLGRLWRFAVLGAEGLIVAGLLLGIAPECLRDPFADLDPLLHDLWLDGVIEAQSLLSIAVRRPAALGTFYFPGLFAITICMWRIWRGERAGLHLNLLVLVAVNWCIALMQVRGAIFANLIGILPISLLLVDLRSRWQESTRRLRAFLAYLLAILASVPAVWAVAGELAVNGVGEMAANGQKSADRCYSSAAMADLRKIKPTLIVDPSNMGASILRFTEHRALSAPYHRNPQGMLAELRIGLAAPDESAPMLKALGEPVLAFCADDPQTAMIVKREPKGLYGRLAEGEIPDFLEPLPVTAGTGVKLFRLKANILPQVAE
ncbi:hypothetical protein I6F26_05985 [Ensifer sp. IC3342]|nr:hypothetical protein [Ensifer sp. BRP08]MCA1446140.1 hypothetical protein [Ensifer sp. IC3342]